MTPALARANANIKNARVIDDVALAFSSTSVEQTIFDARNCLVQCNL
jgi:hypothetical protein